MRELSFTTKSILLVAAFGASLVLLSNAAFAQGGGDLKGLAENVTSNLGAVAQLITAAAWVAGVGFSLGGMMKFKAHRDNPTQVPLSAPIVLLAVGAGLLFLPSVISTAGNTLFKGGTTGGATGQGLSDLGS